MVRGFMMVALLAGCPAPDTASTDGTDDTDAEPAADCDYADRAGRWVGTVEIQERPYTIDMTIEAAASIDEVVGQLVTQLDDGEADACTSTLNCVARPQNEWEAFTSDYVSGPTYCEGSTWVFLAVQDDGSMALQVSLTEFGERQGSGSLTRAR